MGYTTACDIAFGVFVIAWFLTRHLFYMMVCWSIYAYAPVDMAPGCYLADAHSAPTQFIPMSDTTNFIAHGGNDPWRNLLKAYNDRNGPICWNPSLRYYFLALLLSLQIICCFWFGTILKIVYKVLKGNAADDIRSDDDCEDEEEMEPNTHHQQHKQQPYDSTRTILNFTTTCGESGMSAMPKEEEVGAESLSFVKLNGRRMVKRESSRSTGISIPSHADRKELLGRIGCDKPS